MNYVNCVNFANYMNYVNCVWWLKMGSLDGVGGLGLDGLGAVPFCWEHSLKTDWAWIALDCVVLDWLGWHKIWASF
jgi:hypothetical protein